MKFCIVMLSLIAITAHVIQSQTHTVTHDTSEHHPHCSGKQTDIIQQHSDLNINIRVHAGSSQAAFSAEPSHTLCFPMQVRLWLSAAMFMFIKGSDGGLEAFETSWGLCFCCFERKKNKTKWLVLFPFPFALPGTDFLSGRHCALGEWRNVKRRGC